MIEKIILNTDENLSPCVVEWDEKKEDYIIDIPDGISRYNLIKLTEEIKRITELED